VNQAKPALQRLTGVTASQAELMPTGRSPPPVVFQALMTRSDRMISPPATAASSQ
jgi:hypothetical protein